MRAQLFRHVYEQARLNINPDRPCRGGKQNHSIGTGLILKPATWRDEDENQNEGDDDIVPPGCSRKIPKYKLFNKAARRPA